MTITSEWCPLCRPSQIRFLVDGHRPAAWVGGRLVIGTLTWASWWLNAYLLNMIQLCAASGPLLPMLSPLWQARAGL